MTVSMSSKVVVAEGTIPRFTGGSKTAFTLPVIAAELAEYGVSFPLTVTSVTTRKVPIVAKPSLESSTAYTVSAGTAP